MRTFLRGCLAVLCLGISWVTVAAQQIQPLSLRQAVAMSLETNPDRKMARADADSARAGYRLARTALLPSLTFSGSAMRGNDPVYAFGTRLRQQNFQQSDFALNRLNRPTPINNFTTRFSGDWTAFDSWHTEFEIRRADLLAKSSSLAAVRSDEEVVHRVVAAYQSVLLAMRQADLADHEVQTAEALLESSGNRVAAGLAVDSDELIASANLAERQQEQIAEHGRVEIAWAELEAAIGTTIPAEQRQLQLLSERKFDPAPLPELVILALKTRPDRQSLSQEKEAQNTAVKSSKSAFGPQISTFGSWETDRDSIGSAGGNNWLAGAELRIDILPLGKRESLTASRIALRKAQATADAADQQIKLDVTRSYYEHLAASRMLDVARASTSQTEESLRILKDRYEAGLTTITEVLRAEDAQRQSRTNYWSAVSQNMMTYANLRFATGTLTADSVEDLQ
ncbi:MAG TPA: TolC family protein [Acidisarcina sp.]|nr:TolC family protein [Acidisarcina sp.]